MPPFAHEKIDQDGKVTDSKTLEKIRELLVSLIDWTLFIKL
jgi:chromate reductase